ncbi:MULTISPECIES: LysR family transcriptional regulator [unclassified Pseudomonas]|uniref:LysR family transcriptional regulator n=1 Tax=unclassified Pseudomonas TaxID=196821 RepID=UPI002AC90901|nr:MULTISPECIES: LysR family transcriptional regulator [unclassified Pseudomonas]MEB0048447.1 LysR family transcriptional regulator [Pseudomonas sp. Dout3]MEB0098031.1 LysR family transcriptional regulator [Pseudomonas sp. DC1.2]WPX57057.1 LysR family transcriptional regulator [Pseudomonas sp. DC1.2]
MKDPDFQQLRLFMQVAQTKSFTSAADATGLSVSTVSHAVKELEKQLGLRLLNRTTRSVNVTEAGAQLINKIAPLMEDLGLALRSASAAGDEVAGTLRLSVPSSASKLILQPLLRRFLLEHPGINLEVAVDNSLIDIVTQGFDAGIRYDDVLAQDMVVVPILKDMRFVVVASPEYLAGRTLVQHPQDLLQHQCLNYRSAASGALPRWEFENAGKHMRIAVKGRLATNDSDLLLQAALDGFGFAYLSHAPLAAYLESGELVSVLEDWVPTSTLYLYYFERSNTPKKLRAFIDFVKANTEEH